MSGTGLTDDFFRANFSSRYGRPKPHDCVDWIRRDPADDCRAVRVLVGIPLGRAGLRPRHFGAERRPCLTPSENSSGLVSGCARNRTEGFRVLEMYTAIVLDGSPPMPQPHDARPSETVIMIVGVGLGVILPLIAAVFVVLSALR